MVSAIPMKCAAKMLGHHTCVNEHPCNYRTASLLRPARCYAPPPIFGRNYCIGLFDLHYTPPPRGPLEPVYGTAVLARVRVLQV